jgi:hypothetical protein
VGKKRGFLLGTIILAVLAGVAWEYFHSSELHYEGRPLSFWLAGFDPVPPRDVTPQMAGEAVRAIGSNAIPILLKDIQAHDSTLKFKIINFLQGRGVLRNYWTTRYIKCYEAIGAFRSLGSNAISAVPDLMQIYQTNGSPTCQSAVIESLGAIGPGAKAAVPLLAASMKSPFSENRTVTLIALAQIHAAPDLVVPVFINSLADRNPITRQFAARGLGTFGPDASAAVPVLLEMLNLPDSSLRDRAVEALKQIDPETANKALEGKANAPK